MLAESGVSLMVAGGDVGNSVRVVVVVVGGGHGNSVRVVAVVGI